MKVRLTLDVADEVRRAIHFAETGRKGLATRKEVAAFAERAVMRADCMADRAAAPPVVRELRAVTITGRFATGPDLQTVTREAPPADLADIEARVADTYAKDDDITEDEALAVEDDPKCARCGWVESRHGKAGKSCPRGNHGRFTLAG